MNRQTLAVTFGTLALIVIGAILLYASPAPPPVGATEAGKAGKATPIAAKARGDQGKRLPPAKLLHEAPIPEGRPAAPDGAPNVVVVFLSTQRRDQWTVYGGPDNTTPFLAERAAQGVTLMDALTVSPEPRMASGALVTGRYPHRVGAVEPTERRNARALPGDVQTLAERFAEGGWFTVGATGNHNYNHKLGQAQGFDWYRDSQPFSLMLDYRMSAEDVVENVLARVSKRSESERSRPMYVQVAFVDAHKPFRVPPEEFKEFSGDAAPYQAVIRRLDDAIRTLAAGLAAQGLTPENTVFAVLADHGEGLEMPVAHRKQHGFVLYESSIQIPWVMWGAGLPRGRKVDGLASSIDLAPTLAGLAGLTFEGVDGMDLGPALTGKAPRTPRVEAYADTLYEGVNRASLWTTARECQKDYGSKAIEDDAFQTACYDRASDPDFTRPLEDDAMMGRLDEMRAELVKAASGP